jgi:hypothetical protein
MQPRRPVLTRGAPETVVVAFVDELGYFHWVDPSGPIFSSDGSGLGQNLDYGLAGLVRPAALHSVCRVHPSSSGQASWRTILDADLGKRHAARLPPASSDGEGRNTRSRSGVGFCCPARVVASGKFR